VALAGEGLNDGHAAERLLHVDHDLGDAVSDAVVGARRGETEDPGGDEQRRNDGEGDERELSAEGKEDDDGADEEQERLHDHQEAVVDEVADDDHVVGHAGDHAAGAFAVEEAERELLHVREDADAEVAEEVLAGEGGGVDAERLEDVDADREAEEDDRRRHERASVVADDAGVDRLLDDERPGEVDGGEEEDGDGGQQEERPVRGEHRGGAA